MIIFKRKKSLVKRIASLEQKLGLHCIVDEEGYVDHIQDKDDAWNMLSKLEERIKKLEEKGKE